MKVTPLYDRVLLRVIPDSERVTGAGLFVPPIAHAASPMGRAEVIAVGPGRLLGDGQVVPPRVNVGDIVWYSKPAAQAIPYDDSAPGSVVMLREPDIIAVLTELDRATGLLDASGEPAVVPSC